MLGRHEFQPELLSQINLENLIPDNHLLRKIDRVLDLSFVRTMTSHLYCENNGRPSIDPELFFRMTLIMHLYNLPSDRPICEELQFNIAYKWFCKLSVQDRVPDHSSMTKIRDGLGETTFKQIFEHLIKLCIKKKILKADNLMMDGSIFRADASLNSFVNRDDDGKPSQNAAAKNIMGRKYSNHTHVSYTEPDCTLAGKPGELKKLTYKVHETIDRETSLIIDPHVKAGSAMESQVYVDRISHIENTFGVRIEELTADRGYGAGINLKELSERYIKSYIPRFRATAGDRVGRDSEGFVFDAERDCYVCPMGIDLTPAAAATPDYKRYRVKGGQCKHCPLKETCLNIPTMKTRNAKHIEISIYHEYIERAKEMEQTDAFFKLRSEGQWRMEGIFADANNNHGLERVRYR
ncbi:MAG: hypothetical protein EOP06_13500 [Proteobacteria bacterium]|nr:MAG: hypothetical protein EOP06_13500 [Pseudomonadota bacterium]